MSAEEDTSGKSAEESMEAGREPLPTAADGESAAGEKCSSPKVKLELDQFERGGAPSSPGVCIDLTGDSDDEEKASSPTSVACAGGGSYYRFGGKANSLRDRKSLPRTRYFEEDESPDAGKKKKKAKAARVDFEDTSSGDKQVNKKDSLIDCLLSTRSSASPEKATEDDDVTMQEGRELSSPHDEAPKPQSKDKADLHGDAVQKEDAGGLDRNSDDGDESSRFSSSDRAPESDENASLFGSDGNDDDAESSESSLFPSDDRANESDEESGLFGSGGDDVAENKGMTEKVGQGQEKMNGDDDESSDSSLFGDEADSDEESSLFGADGDDTEVVGNERNDQEGFTSAHCNNDEEEWGRGGSLAIKFSVRHQERSIPKRVSEKMKKERSEAVVTDFVTVPVKRMEPECYYFQTQWSHRMQAIALPLKDGPPKSSFVENGTRYEILYSELKKRDGKCRSDDRMGNKYYKAYYLAVSGNDLKKMNRRLALQSIGDFESVTYDKGAHKTTSRLKLLVSPSCRPPGDKGIFCMYRLPQEKFELIEDDQHLGCGFISKDFLVELLGKSVPAQRAFAIQVRITGPSEIGIAKGVLFLKKGIDRIQIPSSMVKVEKSKIKPLHNDVVLNINRIYPSDSHETMERLLNTDRDEPPSQTMLDNLKKPGHDVLRVLIRLGVSEDIIEQYKERFDSLRNETTTKHANLIGVMDPTGSIPKGSVFITGMNEYPSHVFLTRNPCTDAKDGVVVEVVCPLELPRHAGEFLMTIPFGAVVFALGDGLPEKINDGDLDGDLYVCIYDKTIVEIAAGFVHDTNLGEILPDDAFVGTTFIHDMDGKEHFAEVTQRLNPDHFQETNGNSEELYRVDLGSKTLVMTRQEIVEDHDEMAQVIEHRFTTTGRAKRTSRAKKKTLSIDFKCEWRSGKSEWISDRDIRRRHAGAPDSLCQYALTKNLFASEKLPKAFLKWLKKGLGAVSIEEIIDHKMNGQGKLEALCRYGDTAEMWLSFEELEEDCKIFLGAYAKKKNLFSQPHWKKTVGFWLDEVSALMSTKRSNDVSNLVSKMHKYYKRSTNDFDTKAWGWAWKESLKIEKHGGTLELPYNLFRKLPKQLKQFVHLAEE